MGCTSVKVNEKERITLKEEKYKILHIDIDDSVNKFNEDIQSTFKKYKENINEFLESLRYSLIDLRERIFYLTGACCIQEPNLKIAISIFLIDLGRQDKEGIEKFRKAAIFTSKDCLNCVPDNYRDALENIYYYINILTRVNNFDKIMNYFTGDKDKLNNDYDNLRNRIMENANKDCLIGSPLLKNLENIKKLIENFNQRIAPILFKNYYEDKEFLNEFYEGKYFADPKFIEDVNSLANKYKNFGDKYELAYNGIGKEEKIFYGSSPEDGKVKYQKLIELKTKDNRWNKSEKILQFLIEKNNSN